MDHRPLQELRLRDFRCFHEQHAARLAPLTLLVGDNSTGKTSFLAAVRGILEVASFHLEPDFRKAPYDLGSFRDIAHRQRSGRHAEAESFGLGFQRAGIDLESVACDATFTLGDGAAPALATVEWSAGDIWIREYRSGVDPHTELGCTNGSWRLPGGGLGPHANHIEGGLKFATGHFPRTAVESASGGLQPLQHRDVQTVPAERYYEDFGKLYHEAIRFKASAFAEAPIRSRPLRTYESVRIAHDTEGFSVPAFLASTYARHGEAWQEFKQGLEEFGRKSGLFDELFVKRLGKHEYDPFQLEIRKWGKKRKGVKRNLMDVGYGVSQILPLLVELLSDDESLFLLQQPEVHLHPSAQAALGSLFCSTAASGRQLIVETHSEYIIDRVRMEIRDRATDLKAEDVSILFFERTDLDVHIHSLRFDEQGNLLDAPDGYGQFFMDETRRSIGL